MDAIYVQVPCYRDSELPATMRSLFAKAAHPERLRVRVLWQKGQAERLPADLTRRSGLEIESVSAAESQGCNWARRRLQAEWRGERYTLLLDSHHRFVGGWDQMAVGMLEQLRRSGVLRPLLTGYMPGYVPGADPRRRRRRPFKIYPYAREEGVLTRLTSLPVRGWTRLDAPVSADFLSLHFVLADGRFNVDVPFDPVIYFFGDEVLTSLRASAAGYELYHPHRVLGWHAYDRARRVPHWADHADWGERHRRSLQEMAAIYRARGPHAHLRSAVAAYEERIGLSLVIP